MQQNTPSNSEQHQNALRERDQLALTIFDLNTQLEASKERLKAVLNFLSGAEVGYGIKGDQIAAQASAPAQEATPQTVVFTPPAT